MVRPISHTSRLSSRIRNTSASASPICRARLACAGGIRETMTERKMTLSMPSTISSAVRVNNAAQASGVVHNSIMLRNDLRSRIAASLADDIDGDRTERDGSHGADIEVVDEREDRQHGAYDAISDSVSPRSRTTRTGCRTWKGTKVSTIRMATARLASTGGRCSRNK